MSFGTYGTLSWLISAVLISSTKLNHLTIKTSILYRIFYWHYFFSCIIIKLFHVKYSTNYSMNKQEYTDIPQYYLETKPPFKRTMKELCRDFWIHENNFDITIRKVFDSNKIKPFTDRDKEIKFLFDLTIFDQIAMTVSYFLGINTSKAEWLRQWFVVTTLKALKCEYWFLHQIDFNKVVINILDLRGIDTRSKMWPVSLDQATRQSIDNAVEKWRNSIAEKCRMLWTHHDTGRVKMKFSQQTKEELSYPRSFLLESGINDNIVRIIESKSPLWFFKFQWASYLKKNHYDEFINLANTLQWQINNRIKQKVRRTRKLKSNGDALYNVLKQQGINMY